MFNEILGNVALFNGLAEFASLADQDSVVFDEYSLQNEEIIITRLGHESTPFRDFAVSDIPRNDGQFAINDFWRRKVVTMEGILKVTTSSALEAKIDEFKKRLAPRERNLDIKVDGVVRRYVATLINGEKIFDRKSFHITFLPFKLEFVCLVPFGQSVDYVSTSEVDATDLTLTTEFENEGSIKAKPIITLNFSAAVAVTAIEITNSTRGETIRITENIAAPSYVRFDAETLEVTVDGVVVDYEGSFIEMDTGTNSFDITITGTSATYTLTEKHKTPYL